MSQPIYQIDAFSGRVFAGNPGDGCESDQVSRAGWWRVSPGCRAKRRAIPLGSSSAGDATGDSKRLSKEY